MNSLSSLTSKSKFSTISTKSIMNFYLFSFITLLTICGLIIKVEGRGGNGGGGSFGGSIMSNGGHGGEGLCPTVCACKWKGGKQTVECIDRALIRIPENVDPSTQVLDMSGNNLEILPRETFIKAGLHNLQRVFLRNCRLGQIHDEAFKGLTNLVELDLSQNLLTSIPTATFIEISSLRDLTLASNPIQKIESNAFRPIPSLVKLDLSHCEVQMIAPQAFESLELLHSLKLNGNKLSELRPRTVETLSKLHGVELHDNPWLCDCRLRSVKIWLTENNIPYPVAPICSGGPERVIDRTFAELHIDDFACKPEMLPMRRYIEATTGDNATIICRAGAVPNANINWYWNGRLLVNNTGFSTYQKVFIYEDGNFEKRSKLVITNAQETDSSEFYCVAENRAGNAEANFTLHVTLRTVGISTLGNGQIVGLSAALVILILFILLIILFLLIRLRRMPISESKTPGQLEVITSVNPNMNGKVACTTPTSDSNIQDRKNIISNDLKFANPVQKPPRLTDITYSTSHYDGNGSIVTTGNFVSPTASAGNNPDLINDTKRFGSANDLATTLTTDSSSTLLTTSTTMINNNLMDINPTTITANLLNSLAAMDAIDRPGSGEYSRAGCDSLYPSGLWETNTSSSSSVTNNLNNKINHLNNNTNLSALEQTTQHINNTDLYLNRAAANHNNNNINLDDETSSIDYLSRTFPRTHFNSNNHTNNNSVNLANSIVGVASGGGYPSDYGLPIVPGAEQQQTLHQQNKLNNSLQQLHNSHHSQHLNHHPAHHPLHQQQNSINGVPLNAKTIRVWQKGGVPVLPPVTALKRALTNSRNSPDEGYQEGCGTDV